MAFLEMVDVRKRFGGVVALSGASLACERGEVHALLGANGSGKSTLNKILTGVVAPDGGLIRLNNDPVKIDGPGDAQRFGIAAVYQELSLIPQLTVAENIVLARPPVNRLGFVNGRALLEKARGVAHAFETALGRSIPLQERAADLSPGEQQLVEILKALVHEPQVLVLDEATASLHKREVDALFGVVRQLKERGVLVIFISHRMDEIFDICDRATVLRNGRHVGTVRLSDTSDAALVNMMVGEALTGALSRDRTNETKSGGSAEFGQSDDSAEFEEPRDAAELGESGALTAPSASGVADASGASPAKSAKSPGTRASVARATVLRAQSVRTSRLRDVSFELRAGEVLGLGGLQGQGQSELLSVLFGAEPLSAGSIEIGGRPVRLRRPAHAVRKGIAFVPGNRAREGLFLTRPILENVTYASMGRRTGWTGLLRPRREVGAARGMIGRLQVKIGSLTDPVNTLSGGNQQKIVVGKWLLNEPRIILMDDPTKGVDVGAKAELYEVIDELRRDGVAVVLNSSDNAELLALSDRVLVLFEGRAVATLEGDGLTENRLVTASLHLSESA